MVAGIEILPNGIAVFAVSRTPAWHILGQVNVDGEMRCIPMMELSHLKDVEYGKRQAYFLDDNGLPVAVPDWFANVRNHPEVGLTGVACVGKRYHNINPLDIFLWGDDVIGDSGAHWESMGSLFGGKRVFGSILLPDTIGTKYGDDVKVRMTMLSTFDGSGVCQAGVHLERSVCHNTVSANLRAAEHAQQSWKIRHTKNALDRLEEARRALSITFKYSASFEEEMGRLIDQSFTDAEFERLVKNVVIPMPQAITNKETERHLEEERDTVLRIYDSPTEHDGSARLFKGTGWGAYNAVTEYVDWFSPIRAKDHTVRRAEAQLLGEKAGVKTRTLAAIRAAA